MKTGKIKSAKYTNELNSLISTYGELQGDRFIVNTKFGLLSVRVDCPPYSSLLSVFSRFDSVYNFAGVNKPKEGITEAKVVNELLGDDVVGNTGKMNWHFNNTDDYFQYLKADITRTFDRLTK